VSGAGALIQDERLEAIVRGLESTGWAAEVCDADWKLVWVSSQARALIGGQGDGERLGVGKHVLESRMEPAWQRMVQETARDGSVLASKALIERLDPDHARDCGLDPDRVAYRTVGELPDASEKAVRDAGSIPVTAVPGAAG
jgi:hypothetical protein